MVRFDLAKNGGLVTLLKSGWSKPEVEKIWSDGYYSSLIVPTEKSKKNACIKIQLMPYLASGHIDKQRVEIFCWGAAVGFFVLKTGITVVEVVVPSLARSSGWLNMDIKWPDAASPSDLGNADKRVLAAAIFSLDLLDAK